MEIGNSPIQLSFAEGSPHELLNEGSNIIYYGDRNVSASKHEGEVAPKATAIITKPCYVVSPGGSYLELSVVPGRDKPSTMESLSKVGPNGELGLLVGASNEAIWPDSATGVLVSRQTSGASVKIGVGVSRPEEEANGNISIGSTLPALVIGSGEGEAGELGHFNTVFGVGAFNAATTAYGCTIVGQRAGKLLTTGYQNTVFGREALAKATTALENSVFGYQAGFNITTGGFNALFGYQTGSNMTSGEQNSLFGYTAGFHITNAGGNVVMGRSALLENEEGWFNVAIGYEAGKNVKGEKNVFIGKAAGAAAGTVSNKLFIANSNTAEPLIWGDFGAKELRFYTTKMGFFGAAPVTKPAKVETAVGIYEALKSLGLMA